MMDPYKAWDLYHYAHGSCAIKVAGVVELRVDALPIAYRKGLLNMFERGYAITSNKKDAVLRLAHFIASTVGPPFTVSYIGKTQFRTYLPSRAARECLDVIKGTRELAQNEEWSAINLREDAEIGGETLLSMRVYQQRDQEDKTAHMQDKLGALRYILAGFLERDEPRRRQAITFLQDDAGVLRGTFTGQGSIE